MQNKNIINGFVGCLVTGFDYLRPDDKKRAVTNHRKSFNKPVIKGFDWSKLEAIFHYDYNCQQAAKALKVQGQTIRNWAKQGRIKAYKSEYRKLPMLVFKKEDVEKMQQKLDIQRNNLK